MGAVALASLGLLIPTTVLEGAQPDRPQTDAPQPVEVRTAEVAIADIALAPGGVFHGRLLDQAGKGMARVAVVVRHDENQLASTTTDAEGRFSVSNLRGGVVQVDAGTNTAVYRLWAPNTAPPVAQTSAQMIDQQFVRGQSPMGHVLYNPLVILGLVAAAVAIPLAIHHFKENKSGS